MSLPCSLPLRQHVCETDIVPSVSPLTQPQPQSGASSRLSTYGGSNATADSASAPGPTSTVCVLQAALQGHSPAAVVDRLRSPQRAARPKQLATSAASQPQLSQRRPQLNCVSERLASGESTVLSYRVGIFVGSSLSVFCFF